MRLVFGKYEKIRRIAMGGMGEVFLARQTGVLDRLAILKSLRGDLAQEREFVEQFLDEARVAATLNHPNIVSIFDVGEDNGTYYIAMEYVPGEDLSKLWYAAAKAGVGLPFQVSVRICYEAALALEHAHKARDVRGNPLNVVHRDVSPQNIMVRGDGVVKLVDFGIAKAANKSSRTQAGMVKGKLQYMSPEQVRGEALDGRSDQFSLGVVLWEMCTGRRLFKAENEVQTLNKILQAPIPRPSAHVPGFPAELENTIMRMLSREADQRFKSTGDVCNELKGYLDRASISNGEISVAGFVQQILGDELEERTRDLTPMEHTEAGVPLPAPKPKGTQSRASSRPAAAAEAEEPAPISKIVMPAPNDGDTAVLPPVSPPKGQVRTSAGTTLRFDEAPALRQMVLDGQVGPDDTFTLDGVRWQKVREARDLQKFLEIANATREVSNSRGAPRPGPGTAVDPAPSHVEVTKPIATVDPNNPSTLSLNLAPTDRTDPSTGAFSLGDLPPSHTGTWGAPDIAAALRKKEAENANAARGELDTVAPGRAQSRVPTFVWMLGGVAGALLVVVAAVALVAPQLLGLVVAGNDDGAELRKALSVAQADDPAALDALLGTLESSSTSPSADRDAAAALLHVARARVDNSAAALTALAAEAAAASKAAPVAAAVPEAVEKHRVAAYKLAGSARSAEDGVSAALAMAAYHAERGARPELEAEAKRASAAKGSDDLRTLVNAELEVLTLLANADAALSSPDPARHRDAARALEARPGDARARHAAMVLHFAAAARVTPEAREDLARARALLDELAASSASDPRPAAAQKLARLLEDKVKKLPQKPPAAAIVDAGPAVAAAVVDAGVKAGPNAVPSAVRDAGVAVAAASRPDAGPVAVAVPVAVADAGPAAIADAGPPETYESAMARADLAAKQRRWSPAARAYTAALKLKPGDSKAQLGLGWSLLGIEKFEQALVQFQRVVTKDAANAEAYSGLGESLRSLGRTEDAKAAFQKYLELAPNGPDAEIARNAIRALE